MSECGCVELSYAGLQPEPHCRAVGAGQQLQMPPKVSKKQFCFLSDASGAARLEGCFKIMRGRGRKSRRPGPTLSPPLVPLLCLLGWLPASPTPSLLCLSATPGLALGAPSSPFPGFLGDTMDQQGQSVWHSQDKGQERRPWATLPTRKSPITPSVASVSPGCRVCSFTPALSVLSGISLGPSQALWETLCLLTDLHHSPTQDLALLFLS